MRFSRGVLYFYARRRDSGLSHIYLQTFTKYTVICIHYEIYAIVQNRYLLCEQIQCYISSAISSVEMDISILVRYKIRFIFLNRQFFVAAVDSCFLTSPRRIVLFCTALAQSLTPQTPPGIITSDNQVALLLKQSSVIGGPGLFVKS